MSTQEERALTEIFKDPRQYVENFMSIVDKEQQITPFRLNIIQDLYERRSTRRDVVLKPRQIGFSSWRIAKMLAKAITRPGNIGVIIAYEDFITQRLIDKVDSFYNSLPKDLQVPMGHKSASEKSFPDIKSVIYIGTARSFVFARGETIHDALADEFAFWPNPEKIMVPLLQAVPKDGEICVASTPNGQNNEFADLYLSAKQGEETGGSSFKAHFFPWYLHPEYRLSPDEEAALPRDRCSPLKDLMTEEMLLVEAGLSEHQIRWRRSKIAELEQLSKQKDTGLLFKQEYPEDDISCFLVSGQLFYDAEVLDEKYLLCKPPINRLSIEYKLDEYDKDTYRQSVDIWHHPEPGKTYVVSCDPGQGLNTYSAATVWQFHRTNSGEEVGIQCATIHGKIKPENMAPIIVEVGKLYNHAVLAIESNNHGLAVTTNPAVRKYPNLYYRTDVVSGRVKADVGWQTSPKTKPYMMIDTRKLLPKLEINDARIIGECRNMRTDVAGNVFVSGPDDLHDSLTIAVVTRQSQPIARGFVGSAGWDDDWGKGSSSGTVGGISTSIGDGRGYRIA